MNKQESMEAHLPYANGSYPYYVVRIQSGTYQVLPINWQAYRQLIAENCPQIALPEQKPEEFIPSPNELEALLDMGKKIHLDTNKRSCLILGPEHAYYFEPDNVIKEHTSIPKGGVIIGAKGEILKMYFIND